MAAEPVAAPNFHLEFWKVLHKQLSGSPGRAITRMNGLDGLVCDVAYALRQAMPRFECRIINGFLQSSSFDPIPHNDMFAHWPLEASAAAPYIRHYGKFLLELQQRGVLRIMQAQRLSTLHGVHLHITMTEPAALAIIHNRADMLRLCYGR